MRPRYLGPLLIVSCNKGGAYIACELDGTLYHHPIAVYRVILYFMHKHIDLPDFEKYSDISVQQLHNMENSATEDPKDPATQQEAKIDEADMTVWDDPGDERDDRSIGSEFEIFD